MVRCTRYNIYYVTKFVSDWLSAFSLGTPVSSTDETDCHDIAEILLKVALNTITLIIWLFSWVPKYDAYLFLRRMGGDFASG